MRAGNTGNNHVLILVALAGAVLVTFAISAGRRMPSESEFVKMRQEMVRTQIKARGVKDERILDAMRKVERHKLVPEDVGPSAYEDHPLPIGYGQTISQPYIVAYMTEQLALTPTDRVLEIGTGTGYQTAVLAQLCKHVYSIERISELHSSATDRLTALNLMNVSLSVGDGSVGLAKEAPYNAILVTAGAPKTPSSLVAQLADGGRLVAPVGGASEQTIVRVTRRGARTTETPMLACRFVKLVGREGWDTSRPELTNEVDGVRVPRRSTLEEP